MNVTPQPCKTLQLGTWIWDPDRRLLQRDGVERRLKPLLDRLLRRLIQTPGAVLSRDQLIADVWTRREVNDEVLSRAIAELRAALDDDARDPRYIETLAKGGYRWIASVAMAAAPPTEAGASPVVVDAVQSDAADQAQPATQSQRKRPVTLVSLGLLALIAVVVGWRWWPLGGAPPAEPDLLRARPLTADPRLELDPRFDANGRIAYIRRDTESTASELILVDRRGQGERLLWRSQQALRYPAPAPDGSGIAVLHWPAGRCEVWLVELLDAHQRKLTECAGLGGLHWTADAKALLFSAPPDADGRAAGLARLAIVDGSVTRLTTPGVVEGNHLDPRLSADGRWLIYASLRQGERQLWRSDWPALTRRTALLARPEPIFGHSFAASGHDLWIAGDLLHYRALHRLREGQAITLMGGRGALSVDIATDGAIVWTQAEYDGDVWLSGNTGSAPRHVARSNRHESQPAFSHDGKRLALVSNRSGSEGVLLVDLGDDADGDRVTLLRLDPSLRWVRPHWSADDRALILTAYAEQRTRLYRYSLDDGSSTALTSHDGDPFAGVALADRLLYRRGSAAKFELVQQREGSAAIEVVPVGPVSAFRASGEWLLWRSPGDADLRAAPLTAPHASSVVATLDSVDSEAFALVNDRAWYVVDGALWQRHLPHGEPRRNDLPHPTDTARPSLAVSVEGRVAVAGIANVAMDVMIVTPKE